MPTLRRGLRIALFSLAGLTFAVLVVSFQHPRASSSFLAIATAQDLQLSPDTLVGWDRGPVQPIFFSHRRHAGVFEIDCLYCHSNTDRSPVASMPSLALCLGCHRVVKAASSEIAKLRGYEEREEPVPWERVYKLADFVQFNHSRHILAEVECAECHGEVQETDVIYKFAPLTMGWCLDCHWESADEEKIAQATRTAQRFESVEAESHGLYPRSIDSDYGVRRGPIDCAACHY